MDTLRLGPTPTLFLRFANNTAVRRKFLALETGIFWAHRRRPSLMSGSVGLADHQRPDLEAARPFGDTLRQPRRARERPAGEGPSRSQERKGKP